MDFSALDTTQGLEGAWPEGGAPIRPDLIEGYRIQREIGRGASGTVYLAADTETNQPVAIKVLSAYHSHLPDTIARWQREVEILQTLRCAHIVEAHRQGIVAGRRYFVMEYVQGETVAAMLRRRGRLSEAEALNIAGAVARALAAAHERRIIHRDIKPANIIINHSGVVKLMDFGLARQEFDAGVTTHGVILGTPVYVSPEQACGENNLDIRTDIYSLGITLYQMVIGEPPFSEFNTSLLLTKKITDDIPDPRLIQPGLSLAITALIRRMCQRDRNHRFPDPPSLLAAIEQVRRGEYAEAGPAAAAASHQRPGEQVLPTADIEAPILRSILSHEKAPTETRFLDTDEVLFYEDDASRECYVLLIGRLEVLKAGRQIATIERSGTFIGEMSTLLNAPRTATIRALEPTVLLQLTEESFRSFLREAPELAWHLAVTLAQRLEMTNRKLRDSLGKIHIARNHVRVLHREFNE